MRRRADADDPLSAGRGGGEKERDHQDGLPVKLHVRFACLSGRNSLCHGLADWIGAAAFASVLVGASRLGLLLDVDRAALDLTVQAPSRHRFRFDIDGRGQANCCGITAGDANVCQHVLVILFPIDVSDAVGPQWVLMLLECQRGEVVPVASGIGKVVDGTSLARLPCATRGTTPVASRRGSCRRSRSRAARRCGCHSACD